MQLFLIRHTATIACDGIYYGRMDVDVDERHVPAAAVAIRTRLPALEPQIPIMSSPARRCRLLAEALAGCVRFQCSDELCELDFGRWEGKAWDRVPSAEVDAWARDVWEYRVGGGESARMLCERWMRWLEALDTERHEQVVVVTHAGVIRAALACAHTSCRDELLRAEIPFESVHVLNL